MDNGGDNSVKDEEKNTEYERDNNDYAEDDYEQMVGALYDVPQD